MASENENEKREMNESMESIVADMRLDAKLCRDAWLKDPKENPQADCIGVFLDSYARRIEAAWKREQDEMLDALVRIGNWCAQDLAENAFTADTSGNYLKTLNGLCEVCRPFMQKASRLKRYGGEE